MSLQRPLLLTLLVLPGILRAHVLDEYLQAALVSIEPGQIRLAINLTPGALIADQVLILVDPDRDGVISTSEAVNYVQMFKRDLIVRLDERTVELKPIASSFPATAELRDGVGIIKIEFSLSPVSLTPGPHKLAFENRHLPLIGVYLFNAAKPKSDAVKITRQTRNKNQSTGEIEFAYGQ